MLNLENSLGLAIFSVLNSKCKQHQSSFVCSNIPYNASNNDFNVLIGNASSFNIYTIHGSNRYKNKPVELAGFLCAVNLYGIHIIQIYIDVDVNIYTRSYVDVKDATHTWTSWRQLQIS